MLTILPIRKGFKDLHHVERLYRRAFPKNERDSMHHLLKESNTRSDFIAFYDKELFCGFAYLLTHAGLTHILYFAIDDALRDHGYGAKALQAIKEWKAGNRILADVEVEEPNCENLFQRSRRIHFYLSNGFLPTDIRYTWNEVDYEILSYGGTVLSDEFDDFWQYFREDEDMGDFLYQSFKKKLTTQA